MQYYITYRQLFFLLSGSGIDSLYGMRPDNISEILSDFQKKDNIFRDMIDLYQHGVVSWENDKIRINEPFYSFISIFKQAEHCLECINTKETSVLYQQDDVFLRVSPSLNDQNRIAVRMIMGQDIYQELGLEALEKTSLFPESASEDYPFHDQDTLQEVLMIFKLRDAHSGDRIWDVHVIVSGIYTYLQIFEKDKIKNIALNRNNINKLLFAGKNI